jgi:hypothetical protein
MPTRVADASLVTLGRCSQHRTRVRASHARAAHASAAARPLCAPGRRYSRASTVRSSVRSSATEAETLSEERRRLERSLAASRLAVETMGERIVDAEQLRSTAKHRCVGHPGSTSVVCPAVPCIARPPRLDCTPSAVSPDAECYYVPHAVQLWPPGGSSRPQWLPRLGFSCSLARPLRWPAQPPPC